MRAWLLRVPEARRLLMTFQPAPISGQSDSSPAKALGAASHAMAPKNEQTRKQKCIMRSECARASPISPSLLFLIYRSKSGTETKKTPLACHPQIRDTIPMQRMITRRLQTTQQRQHLSRSRDPSQPPLPSIQGVQSSCAASSARCWRWRHRRTVHECAGPRGGEGTPRGGERTILLTAARRAAAEECSTATRRTGSAAEPGRLGAIRSRGRACTTGTGPVSTGGRRP